MLKISTVKENCFHGNVSSRGKRIAEEKAYKSFLIEEISEDTKRSECTGKGQWQQMV